MTDQTVSPYTMDEAPTSSGKALLSRAFAHWCTLHHGYSEEDIAAVFSAEPVAEQAVKENVTFAARLIGELIAAGEMRTVARPFGGGNPEKVPTGHWELDDFRPRFARSAMNLRRPFEADADPTHWIFVDLEDFNRLVEQSCGEFVPHRPPTSKPSSVAHVENDEAPTTREDRHVRMPELERRTGMSRSTIYRRIRAGRFPESLPMTGNIASWRESDVANWLANPR